MAIFLRDPMRILSPTQREQLRNLHLRSAGQLANRVLADHEFLNQFDKEMRRRLVLITAQVVRPRARSVLQASYRAHALDILLVAAVLLIGIAICRDFYAPEKPRIPEVVVQRPGGLPPFHVIVPADLALAKPTANPAGVIGEFNGRYSTTYIAAGGKVTEEKLSGGLRLSTELNDRFIVRLKAQATSVFSGMAPPYRAALIAAPHERGASALFLNDVLVLDLQTAGDGLAAVLALRASDEATLSAFMASSDFYLVARQP